MKFIKPICILFLLSLIEVAFINLFANTPINAEEDFGGDITISNTTFHFSEGERCSYISCIGQIENNSDETYENLVIEVNYFNNNGDLIDTITDELYASVLGPYKTITFRVRDSADKSADQYSKHSVKLTSADKMCVDDYENTSDFKGLFWRLFISWGPMFLLIAVWIFFILRLRSKKSPQGQSLALLSKQLELLEEQNSLFSKLINSIDKLSAKKSDL